MKQAKPKGNAAQPNEIPAAFLTELGTYLSNQKGADLQLVQILKNHILKVLPPKTPSPRRGPQFSNLQMSVPIRRRPTGRQRMAVPLPASASGANVAGFGRTKLYELMDDGAVETTKIGRRRLVRVPSLLRFLAQDQP